MDKNLKMLATWAALVIIVGIVALAATYAWILYDFSTHGSSGSLGSLGMSYSGNNGSSLNETQYSSDGSFAGRIYVEGTANTLLVALVDYNVTAFSYNGSVNTTHMIPAKSFINETGYVTPTDPAMTKGAFNVTGIPEGFHDVQFLGFVDPYNYSSPWGMSDGPFSSGGVRFNVIVDNSSKHRLLDTDGPGSNDTVYAGTSEFPSDGPSLSQKPFSAQGWPKENVKANGTIDYYVNLAHPMFDNRQTDYNFTIVQLLDYRQIPIRVGSPDTVYYGRLDNGTFASARMSLKAPDTPGNYKLIVIVSGDPYADVEVAPYMENNMTWTTNKNATIFTDVEHQDIIVS